MNVFIIMKLSSPRFFLNQRRHTRAFVVGFGFWIVGCFSLVFQPLSQSQWITLDLFISTTYFLVPSALKWQETRQNFSFQQWYQNVLAKSRVLIGWWSPYCIPNETEIRYLHILWDPSQQQFTQSTDQNCCTYIWTGEFLDLMKRRLTWYLPCSSLQESKRCSFSSNRVPLTVFQSKNMVT